MRLERGRCEKLVSAAGRGVLATVHPVRGADAVPACFVVDDNQVAVPVDRIKAKASVDLQRITNLEHDGRATLLCDHWDARDWSRLWWVRVSMEYTAVAGVRQAQLESLLASKYPQYEDADFASLLVFRVVEMTGWSAGEHPGPEGH